MDIKGKPTIKKCAGEPYTKITFKPDLKRFGINKLDDDIISLMEKRIYDATATTSDKVNVFLNNKKLNYKSLEKYVEYYLILV